MIGIGSIETRLQFATVDSTASSLNDLGSNVVSGSTSITLDKHQVILERMAEHDPEGARTARSTHLESVGSFWRAHREGTVTKARGCGT